MKTMIAALDDVADAKTAQRFLFKTKPEFGKYWTVPPVMTDLFTAPWTRLGDPLSIAGA